MGSDDPSPSPNYSCSRCSGARVQVSNRLRRGGELLGISLLDHVVIGDGRYVSFADDGLL